MDTVQLLKMKFATVRKYQLHSYIRCWKFPLLNSLKGDHRLTHASNSCSITLKDARCLQAEEHMHIVAV